MNKVAMNIPAHLLVNIYMNSNGSKSIDGIHGLLGENFSDSALDFAIAALRKSSPVPSPKKSTARIQAASVRDRVRD